MKTGTCNLQIVVWTYNLLLAATGCDMLDMYDEPRFEPLEASTFFDDGTSARSLLPGTVARGQLRDDDAFYTGKVEGKYVTEIPVDLNRELLSRGQERFNIYCSPCHGRVGNGEGMIVKRGFRKPPSFVSTERLLKSPVGHFYDVISNGFGAMPSYASRVEPHDRWAIVAYIRALQRSQNGTLDDVPEDLRDKIPESESVQETEAEQRDAAEQLDIERQRKLERDIREHRRSPEEGQRRHEEIEREKREKESDDAEKQSAVGSGFPLPFSDGPHPACPDGGRDGEVEKMPANRQGPIQLAWMVNKIRGGRAAAGQSPSPSRQAGWGRSGLRPSRLANHLVHHPGKPDGGRVRALAALSQLEARA